MTGTTRTTLDLLQSLVRIPSPNPPGDTCAIAVYIADALRPLHCTVLTLDPAAKSQAVSVVATVGQGDPVIMLHAHMDTEPLAENEANGWHVDPYAAAIQDGRLYGKGSVDDKAVLAAMLHLFMDYAERPEALKGTLVLVAAAEEEVGGQLGTRWLADNGHLPQADFIVVGKQTHNRVATAHKGVLRATVRAAGRSVHATIPDRGVNAITAMAKAVIALEAYHQALASRNYPLVGVPTCNVGVIHGGSTTSAVPDTCVAYLDRRMIPGEDPEAVKAELTAVIAGVNAAPAQLTVGDFLVSDWFSSTCESALGQCFLTCVRDALNADPGPIAYLPGSDAQHLRGVCRGEMVIFGPGSYEVSHAADEYVDLEEFHTAHAILKRYIDETLIDREKAQ